MFERFTERARNVVVCAQEEARTTKCMYVGTEHLLLGLLRDQDALANQVLTHLGVTLEKARESVEPRLTGRAEEMTAGAIPFTPKIKQVLENTLRHALSLGHNYVGTEHILLALVDSGENIAVEVLRDDFHCSPDRILLEVKRMLKGPEPKKIMQGEKVDRLQKLRDAVHEDEEREQRETGMMIEAITLARDYTALDPEAIAKAVRANYR